MKIKYVAWKLTAVAAAALATPLVWTALAWPQSHAAKPATAAPAPLAAVAAPAAPPSPAVQPETAPAQDASSTATIVKVVMVPHYVYVYDDGSPATQGAAASTTGAKTASAAPATVSQTTASTTTASSGSAPAPALSVPTSSALRGRAAKLEH